MRPRKRCRCAPAASRRLFIRPSGRGCLRLSLRSFRLSARSICPARSAASGQQARRYTVSRPDGAHLARGRTQSEWFRLCPFCPRPSVRALPPAPLRPFKSRLGESREPESRKVESRQRVVNQSRQSRKSRQVKSRKVVSLIAGSRVVRGQCLCVLLSKLFRRNICTERLSRCNHNVLLIFHAKVVFRPEDVNDGVYLAFCR